MAQVPHADPGLICPLHKVDVSEVCHKCPWWIYLRGQDANRPGVYIDEWGCAVGFLPRVIIEGNRVQLGTAASIDSFRNELVKGIIEGTEEAVMRLAPKG